MVVHRLSAIRIQHLFSNYRRCLLLAIPLMLTCFFSGNGMAQASGKTHQIAFKAVRDVIALAKKYPFLAKEMAEIKEEGMTDVGVDSLQVQGKRLLFIQLSGMLFRGTEGTPVTVYIHTGKAYQEALSVTTHDNIVVMDTLPITLLTPTGTGKKTRWVLDAVSGTFRIRK